MPKLFKLLLILIIIFIALIVFFIFKEIITNRNLRGKVYEIAYQLEYHDDNFVDEYKSCYDIFTHCYKILIFKTSYDFEKFSALVKNTRLFTSDGFNIEGYEIFTKINLSSNNSITINGSEAFGNRSALPKLSAHRWNQNIPNSNNFISIDFYDLKKVEHIMLDGQEMKQNLVLVSYQYK